MSAGLSSREAVRRSLLTAFELCALAAAGASAAVFFWAAVSPANTPTSTGPGATASSGGVLPAANPPGLDPFLRGEAQLAGAPESGVAQDYTLYATRVAGQASSAILSGPGLQQATYRIGDAVGDGRMVEVMHDRVMIERNGQRLTIQFPQAPSVGLPVPNAGAADTANASAFPGLSPVAPGKQNSGYRVDGGSGVLAAAGFQAGDILLTVDGKVLSAASVLDLQTRLASGETADIRYERNGQTMTRRIGGSAQ